MQDKKSFLKLIFSVTLTALCIAAFIVFLITFSDAFALKREMQAATDEKTAEAAGVSFALVLVFNIIALFLNTVISSASALVSHSLFKKSGGGLRIYAGIALGISVFTVLLGTVLFLVTVL